MFEDFDFDALKNKDYKEDAVREDLVAPLLKALGYSPTGPHRMTRSKTLTDPYCIIGTQKRKINIFPDYTLSVNNKNVLVLDAKSPQESVDDKHHHQQAYSYAIHPDVRARYYGICNGRELLIFDRDTITPVLRTSLKSLQTKNNWAEVYNLISVVAFESPHLLTYKPDYGIHLLKAGYGNDVDNYHYEVPIDYLQKVNDSLITFFSGRAEGDIEYSMSFDIPLAVLKKELYAQNTEQAFKILEALTRQPYAADVSPPIFVNMTSRIGRVEKNAKEQYAPFVVNKLEII